MHLPCMIIKKMSNDAIGWTRDHKCRAIKIGDDAPLSYVYHWGWWVCVWDLDTLQHTATHCNTLQHTATHCNTLLYVCMYLLTHIHRWWWVCVWDLDTLQHTATHCNTLQHTATHCYICVCIYTHIYTGDDRYVFETGTPPTPMHCDVTDVLERARASPTATRTRVLAGALGLVSVLQCVAVCCSECVAVCWECVSVLQCVAVCCSATRTRF